MDKNHMSDETHSLSEVGIIIGRFQCPFLHEGHRDVIDQVRTNHPRVIIFIGVSYCKATKKNPLDYITRKRMIEETYPDVEVLPINDVNDDYKWSKNLDTLIGMMVGPGQRIILYGSRDSFIAHYGGKYRTVELVPKKVISASDIRKQMAVRSLNTQDFRTGIIWTTQNQYDAVVPCVDIVPWDKIKNTLLIIRKPQEHLYRFIGGHAEPNSQSYEEDAIRETKEETGVVVDNVQYVGSSFIDDPRFRGEANKIKTVFFIADFIRGTPKPSDDIEGGEAVWESVETTLKMPFMPEHQPLIEMLRRWFFKTALT